MNEEVTEVITVEELLHHLEKITGYRSVKETSQYLGVSVKTLRGWMKEGLPYYQKGGVTVIKRAEADLWISKYRVQNGALDLDLAHKKALELMGS